MTERRLQWLRPGEVLAAQAEKAVAYLPIGPIEWHGPHLPLGTDAFQAEAVALGAAERVGGVVHPPLYLGTDRPHNPETLRNLGFTGHERIVGMNFPSVTFPSFYTPEEQLALIVRWTVEGLAAHGFKLVVLVNGHGALNQIEQLKRVVDEMNAQGPARVLYTFTDDLSGPDISLDHACITETSAILALDQERVDLAALPPIGEPLHIPDWGIADGASFGGQPTADHSVPAEADPRRATAEFGRRYLEAAIQGLALRVTTAWEEV